MKSPITVGLLYRNDYSKTKMNIIFEISFVDILLKNFYFIKN